MMLRCFGWLLGVGDQWLGDLVVVRLLPYGVAIRLLGD